VLEVIRRMDKIDEKYFTLLERFNVLKKERSELIEENIRLLKYKRFVHHIYNHKYELIDKKEPHPIKVDYIKLEDWVICKICKKTFREIVKDGKK